MRGVETGPMKDFNECTVKEIDHIGIAVHSLDEAVDTYEANLGLACEGREEIEEQQVITATFRVGSVSIELLQPSHSEGPIANFLRKRGEGIHHIAYRVGNIATCLDELKLKEIPLIDQEPRIGAGGSKIAFIHPKGMRGVLVELVERTL